ncbi:MAG: 4-hydroxy-3-methylbut-2-enyl diphosphate reductase [Epulopiscium sp.]|nr:4-hydroxy-3-methylbut-2-enyl diphosphate reductase [Candidatus Epulonipiscium sp.]
MDKEIIIAEHAGFCFGVKRAVEMTVNHEKIGGTDTYTLGPLIHNSDVINRLKDNDINPITNNEIESLSNKDNIVIRSHGVTKDTIDKIKKTGANMIDATCPFVSSIHKKAKRYHDLGYQIIIVGDKNHPEVIGINGWCDNTAIITKDGSDLNNLPDKVCIASQTTERLINYETVVNIVSKKCKEVIAFNTICNATKERQNSADEVSKRVDLMIVIGGKNSSNSKKLFEICSINCKNTIFIENSKELSKDIINQNDIRKIGITAGASTPDWVINDIINKIKNEK